MESATLRPPAAERTKLTEGASAPSETAAAERTPGVLLAALVAAAVVLRVVGLGTELWLDEMITSILSIRPPLLELLTVYKGDNQHPLYSLLAHMSTSVLGDTPLAMRLPAMLFGVASVPMLYMLGSRLVSRREALLAAALLAVSYHHVWFSQNARGYTGLLLWTLVGSLAFLELVAGRPDRRGRMVAVYAVAMGLAAWTHVTGAFVVMAHALIWAALAARRGERGRLAPAVAIVLSGLVTLLVYAPVLPQLFHTVLTPTMEGTDTVWKSPWWMVAETARGLSRGLPGGMATLVLGVLVLGGGLVSWWRRSPAVAAMLVVPVLVTAGLLFVVAHNLWPRFFFFAAGFAMMIAVRGVFVAVRAVLPGANAVPGTAALTLVILGSLLGVHRAWGPKQDYEGAARYVTSVAGQNDAVVAVDLTAYPYARYYGTAWPSVDNLQTLEEIERRHRKTWLLYTFPIRLSAVHPDIWDRLQSRYDTAAVFPGTVGGGAVVVMVSR